MLGGGVYDIPELVVTGEALPLGGTTDSVIAPNIAIPTTGHTWPCADKHRETETVSDCSPELGAREMKAQRLDWDDVQPVPRPLQTAALNPGEIATFR